MKIFNKIILYTVPLILIVSSVGGYFIIPFFRIISDEWIQKSSSEEIRKNAHKVLKLGAQHDACIQLIYHGNKESIPYLLKEIKEIKNEDFIDCTYVHCLDALVKITGQDYGYDYDSWVKNIKIN